MMSFNFRGRVAIITGGSGALGREVTKLAVKSGAKVAVPYIIDEEIALLKKALGSSSNNVTLAKVDMAQWSQISSFVSSVSRQFKRIDILLNLVGGYFGGPLTHETDEKDWDRIMNLNLKIQFLACKAAIPHMLRRKYGRIVNVSSEAAIRGEATLGVYSVSKSGVVRLTETISEEYRLSGITANSVMPRIIDTPANRTAMPDADFSKWPKPEEIARVILFLASEDTKVVTGASVPVIGLA